MRLGIIAGKATSLINVAKDIAYVAQRRGHVPRILTYVESPTMLAKSGDGFILVYPAVPLFCAEYMLLYRELRVNHGKPAVYYTMIEGRPRRHHIAPWMRRDVEFVAVSRYVREKLIDAGFRVLGVVPHGLVREVVSEAEKTFNLLLKCIPQIPEGLFPMFWNFLLSLDFSMLHLDSNQRLTGGLPFYCLLTSPKIPLSSPPYSHLQSFYCLLTSPTNS